MACVGIPRKIHKECVGIHQILSIKYPTFYTNNYLTDVTIYSQH